MKLLLFDLDGTLLRSDKTISQRTRDTLEKCRKKGSIIGISTSRALYNCMAFFPELEPDLVIASGGAVVKYRGAYIYTAEFSENETSAMIATAREICGSDCEITVDTVESHYWNYKEDPSLADATWGKPIYTDYVNFTQKALKVCVQTADPNCAEQLSARLSACDCMKFSGSDWYKFTRKNVTKESAIQKACLACGVSLQDVIAFGDDGPDIGMLQLCGTGVAMGNAIDLVKENADVVIGSNDEDGIAEYLEKCLLKQE